MVDKQRPLSILFKPRYSPLHLVSLLLVAFAIMAVGVAYRVNQVKRVLFRSPLAQVVAAEMAVDGVPDSTAYRGKYDFPGADWFTLNIPVWQKVLEPFKGKPGVNYLEIGVFEGRSVIWMLENILTDPTARVTGIDIFDDSTYSYKDNYFKNIEKSGSADKVTTIKDFSQLALRGLPLGSFDIIYIDGSHAKDDVLEDAVLSWRLLKEGGVLIFDDYTWAGHSFNRTSVDPVESPKVAIDPFVQCFGEHLKVIHNSRQLIVKKLSQ